MDPPQITIAEIKELILDVYGLCSEHLTRLDGYDDLNYLVLVGRDSGNPYISYPAKNGYLLKISNGCFTSTPDLLKLQNSLMIHVSNNLGEISVPFPQLTLQGEAQVFVNLPWKSESGSPFIVRLLTFIPGKPLSSLRSEPSTECLLQVGKLAAQMTCVLKEFKLDGSAKILKARTLLWSLEGITAGFLDPMLKAIDDQSRLEVFKAVISEFRQQFGAAFSKLRRGVIHGDINEGNLIMAERARETCTETTERPFILNGLVDFSDVHESCCVFELVLAICYMMMECEAKGIMCPIVGGGLVLAGYLSIHPLDADELDILKIAIEARCTQSLVIGLYTYKYEQQGNVYVLNTQEKGWAVLTVLLKAQTCTILMLYIKTETLGRPGTSGLSNKGRASRKVDRT